MKPATSGLIVVADRARVIAASVEDLADEARQNGLDGRELREIEIASTILSRVSVLVEGRLSPALAIVAREEGGEDEHLACGQALEQAPVLRIVPAGADAPERTEDTCVACGAQFESRASCPLCGYRAEGIVAHTTHDDDAVTPSHAASRRISARFARMAALVGALLVTAACSAPSPLAPTLPEGFEPTPPSPKPPCGFTAPCIAPGVIGRPIASTFFGMHLVSVWSPNTVWPDAPIGSYRLLNATPRWHRLHVGPGVFAEDAIAGGSMTRIEAVLLFRDRHAPAAEPIFTLAGGDPTSPSGFPAWLGSDTIGAWRAYVREVATRFRGRIHLWEIWNEPDCACAYGGSTELLVALTNAAAAELRAVDPANRVLSPAFTEYGLGAMDAFLAAGGAEHVDVIAWHQDNAAMPEQDLATIAEVRGMMREHGASDLPLWTTEGHPRAGDGDPVAITARTLLTLWLGGVERFHWYAWDITDYGAAFPGPWVTLTEPGRPDTPTAAGRAYAEVARWMVGARVQDVDMSRGRWIVTLDTPAGTALVVWSTDADAPAATLPAGTLRTLDGLATPFAGGSFHASARPVLLEVAA